MQDKLIKTLKHLEELLPVLSKIEKNISMFLYVTLAKGKPIELKQLSNKFNINKSTLSKVLNNISHIEYNQKKQITAYRVKGGQVA